MNNKLKKQIKNVLETKGWQEIENMLLNEIEKEIKCERKSNEEIAREAQAIEINKQVINNFLIKLKTLASEDDQPKQRYK